MRYFPVLFFLLAPLMGCQKSGSDGPADLFEGHALAGKWILVQSQVQLKFDDGSVQNATLNGNPDTYLDFTHTKTTHHQAEGTFTSLGFGVTAHGKWTLAQADATLDLIYTDQTPALYQFRRIDELDAHRLVMSADDQLVRLIYETNDLNDGASKKVVGGSIFEEYQR